MAAKRRQYVSTDKPEVHGNTAHTTTGTPGNSALGDAAAAGSSASVAKVDHVHGRESSGTTAAAIGTSAGGSATTPSKSDHVHATGAGTPTTSASGDAAATGSGPAAAMTDHVHGRENAITKFDFGSSGAQVTGTGALRLYNRTGRTLTIYGVNLALSTAPTGTTSTPVTNATFVVDVNINGTTIWATQSQRACIIPATDANVGYFTTFGTTTITDGQYFTWDTDFVGSTIAGSNLTLQIFCKG